MPTEAKADLNLDFQPLTPERWPDLESLFGTRGACGGCWCMWWKLPRAAFEQGKGDGNRKALKKIVAAGTVPGILAYHEGVPVGWCAVEPRAHYQRFDKSRVLKPVDDTPVWAVTCFFVAKPYRGRGIMTRLLQAAKDHARRHGATLLEGYPVEPSKGRLPDPFVYTGLPSAYRAAGFVEVARRSPTRPIMRCTLEASGRRRSRKQKGGTS
jgi:GNAT superfamily N-acetyltransferase